MARELITLPIYPHGSTRPNTERPNTASPRCIVPDCTSTVATGPLTLIQTRLNHQPLAEWRVCF